MTASGPYNNLQWSQSNLAKNLFNIENSRISQILPDLFGYHILQLRGLWNESLLTSSRITHQIKCDYDSGQISGNNPEVVCHNNALPFARQSLDVVVLPHVLEFDQNPHQTLRETERILIGEGYLLVIGFNPWSLWGLWRSFLAWKGIPWHKRYISIARLKDWLSLLDFDVINTERFFFRPPLQHQGIMDKLGFFEILGRYCWPVFGGCYLLQAQKRVTPLTPVKLQWQSRRHMISSGLIEPSANFQNDHEC